MWGGEGGVAQDKGVPGLVGHARGCEGSRDDDAGGPNEEGEDIHPPHWSRDAHPHLPQSPQPSWGGGGRHGHDQGLQLHDSFTWGDVGETQGGREREQCLLDCAQGTA